MSQVIRKYNSGGQTDKPKLLSIKGLGDFNQDDLIKRGYRDVDEYTSSKGLKNAAAADFRNAVQYMLEGMNNGTITMDAMGNFQDATGQKSSTGELDRKKFLGIKTGVKNTENNAYGLAADYLYNIIKGAPQYKQPEVKAEKFNTNDYLTKEISKRWYGGNNIDFGNWFKNRSEKDRNALIADIFNSADYNKLYQEHDWTDTGINSVEDLMARGRAFGSAISNNKLDNDDYNTFATLGGSDLDKFMKAAVEAQPAQAPAVEGQQGRTDRGWSNSEYDRTIDEKGQYHIYIKGTNQEVSGILPGNVFEGVGNKYAFNGNIYDDSNLPEQYRQDITRARQAQLNEYTRLTDNNPFTKMLRGRGYNYITNLSQFASGAGDNILYGAYSDPSDVSGKSEFYLKNPTTGEVRNGSVEFNKSLGQYQFVGSDGNIVNLGTYNPAGARSNQGTSFIDYSDVSESNRDNLFSAWMNDSGLNNPASDAYKMVQSTLSKWISSGQSPFVSYKGQYQWKSGDDVMNVRKGPDGQWQWSFNKGFDNSQTQKNERLEALLRIPINQRTREINDEILRLRGYRKEGGVITAQLGTKFTKVEDTPSVTRPKISEEQAKKNQAAHQSFTGRSNASLGNDKDITDAGGVIKTSDKVRLGAAMADLASVGLGFVPGANLASTGIGVGSSLAEFGADWASDGLDLGDAGRLAMNLGMDALSLIPVGKTLKATRALGKIRKSIPLIMTAVNAANFLDPTLRAEYSKTLSKLTKGDTESLNTGDFKNLSAIASTVLMGKNYAQSKKGWWNSSTTPSGKRKVTAMIDGKQQTLEVDDAFFQNTKGKNQVSELKAKFAQQYNKANNLEGDNAIKPESVSIDTKYFGLRPQSEKVEGTKNAGNWVADTKIGNYWLGYRDASQPRGNANIPFSDAWFYKNGIVGGRTRAEKNDIRNRWAESRKRAGEIKNKRDSEIAQKGVEGVSNLVQALNYASKYRTAPLALPAPGQATPSNRVFVMGDGRQRQPFDKTDPSKLSKPGTYQDRAVHTGGTPVESPNANAVRTVRTINSILEPFVPKTTNLPAVIPASRNANKVVASQTIQPSQRLDQFIEGQIPGRRQFGKQRAKTEREYRDVFHPAAEREYNAVWDEAVRNRKDFGYEEVFPKRSPYAPPTPTEVYVVPEGAMKDPNARYLWELINKKPNTNHTKRADLPHKKSNKKKKTSKDDRVTKKAEGGLIQFLQGGDTVGRIKAKDMSNWNRASALANYDWVADIDRWKASHTGPDDWQSSYMLSFNGGEDIYDQLTDKTGDYFGGKYNYSVQDPLAKQRQITFRGTNQGFDDLIRNGIVGYGTTEGTTGFDVYAGDRTGNRTLARGMTPEDVARFNKQLATRGMELYDKGNGTYRLRALQEPTQHLDEVVVTAPKVEAGDTTNPSGIKRVTSTPKKKLKLNVAPEEVLALGRMVGGLAANNRAAKVYKEGLKPTLLDTFENTVPLQGNFQAKTNAEQQAGNLESVAARPRTSDASLQLAGELEASDRAGQARFQGGLQDAEMFYKTRMLGQQESDAAKARRVEVANRNRASMNAIDAAKKQIDAGRITANYQQVIAPYLAGVENRFRQARGMKNQLALESYLNRVGSEYDTELAKIGETYKNDPVGAQREISKLRSKYQSDALKERTSLIDTPWLVRFSGKGSKLSYAEKAMLQRAKDFNKRLSDDNKQFHKDIMESKREHNKMIANMSALTAALIKKGMQL